MYCMIMFVGFPVYRCFACECGSLWRIHYCTGVVRSETLWNSSRGDDDPVARLARTALGADVTQRCHPTAPQVSLVNDLDLVVADPLGRRW